MRMNAITTIPTSPLTEAGKRLHALDQEMIRLENLGLFDSQAYRHLDKEHDKLLCQAMAWSPSRCAMLLSLPSAWPIISGL
jgi:hypothetical protein